jgi:hypothetical protein
MSETEIKSAANTAPVAATTADRVKKITVGVFGGGRKPSEEEQKAGGAIIGTIMGKATGFRVGTTTDPKTGEVSEHTAITGAFRAVYNDASKSPMQGGTLYLPDGFHQDLLDAIAPVDAASGERKLNGQAVEFAFWVKCIASTNLAGYSYVITPLHDSKANENEELFTRLGGIASGKLKALTVAPGDVSHVEGKTPAKNK